MRYYIKYKHNRTMQGGTARWQRITIDGHEQGFNSIKEALEIAKRLPGNPRDYLIDDTQEPGCISVKELMQVQANEHRTRLRRWRRWGEDERKVTMRNLLASLFQHYNRLYFEGRLPLVRIVICEKEEGSGGLAGRYDQAEGTIYLYASDETPPFNIGQTLLHEMIHVSVPEDPGHGACFRAELQRVAEAGNDDAEQEVWLMVCDCIWDDGWIGEESGRWGRFRMEHREGDDGCCCSDCWRRNPTPSELGAAPTETHS